MGMRRIVLSVLLSGLLFSCNNAENEKKVPSNLVRYPEKGEMILLTDRPPQLETPQKIFRQDITPNEYFFVRWHLAKLPTKINIDTFRLYVHGAVNTTLALSINDLKTKFPVDSIVALAICSGNSRSTFNPKVPGSQWKNGAMGNAVWKGVKVKDILQVAGIKSDAVDVTFQGMDNPPQPGVAPFIKSLDVKHAMDGEVMIAYEMNGKDIPMLNGYPLKLVVPGWYATYWVGALNQVNVLNKKFDGFWMTKAYQIVNNKEANESPDSPSKNTVPMTSINMHSVFVEPDSEQTVEAGKPFTVEGLAYTDGTGIAKVELSLDNGVTWQSTTLNPELGKYSWRRWKYNWTPETTGLYHLQVRATDVTGHTQVQKQWNRSGYARGFIEHLDVNVK